MKKTTILFITLLLISSMLVGSVGAVLKYCLLQPLGIDRTEHLIALPFVMLADDMLKKQVEYKLELANNPPTEPPTEPVEPTLAPTQAPTEPPLEAPTEPPTEPPLVPVEESWFDDALFIGNSLTVGLRDYAPLGKADYFCDIGMNVFDTLEQKNTIKNFGYTTLENLLANRTYGKVYIHLGTNECGYPHELVLENYQAILDLIREYQKDAVIIIQAVTSFGRRKGREYTYMNPETITALNAQLQALAEGKNMRFIDFNPEVVDEEGYLPDDWSGDGCHPTVDGYRQWSQWIWDNAPTLHIPQKQEERPFLPGIDPQVVP